MKLRFVKFFTSRENEIEKKEGGEEGVGLPSRALSSLSQAAARARSRFLLSPSLPFSLPPPSPTSPHRPAPACRPPRVGRAMPSSYPLPSYSASPFLLHKLPKRKSVEGRTVAERPACRPSCNRRAPSSPHPCSFIQSDGRGFSPVPMAPSLWRLEP